MSLTFMYKDTHHENELYIEDDSQDPPEGHPIGHFILCPREQDFAAPSTGSHLYSILFIAILGKLWTHGHF